MPKDMPDHDKDGQEDKVEMLSHPSYEELMQKLSLAEQKADQYWDRILRMQAENENAQRRVERDIANAHKYALEKFILELLPIVDSLELCTTNVSGDIQAAAGPVLEGVSLTLKMFYTALEKFGVKQINPLGNSFDPEFHQAISMQAHAKAAPGTVLTVLQKGYLLNNRLIRPALVVVAQAEA